MSEGHVQCANKWHTYFVNEYEFHNQTHTKGKKTINTERVTNGGEDDLYGVIIHI